MGVPLAEKSHKPIFLKSRDGCPEFENLRNKNIFGLEDFSGPKKSEYFAFFIFETKKHYTVPIGGLWPEIKLKKRFSGIAYYTAWEWHSKNLGALHAEPREIYTRAKGGGGFGF